MHLPREDTGTQGASDSGNPFLIISGFAAPVILPFVQTATSQTTSVPSQRKIGGEVSPPLTLTVTDLKNMPEQLFTLQIHMRKSPKHTKVFHFRNYCTGQVPLMVSSSAEPS
jgi:hypothetical protein